MKKEEKIGGFERKKLTQWFLYWLVLGLGMVVLIFLITSTWIGVDVRERCFTARSKYGGTCVSSLMETLRDESNSYRTRNYAIWSLGQLGDDQALPALEEMYTGIIPEREPYDEGISQYELKKAIALVTGGTNITAFVWRVGLVGE